MVAYTFGDGPLGLELTTVGARSTGGVSYCCAVAGMPAGEQAALLGVPLGARLCKVGSVDTRGMGAEEVRTLLRQHVARPLTLELEVPAEAAPSDALPPAAAVPGVPVAEHDKKLDVEKTDDNASSSNTGSTHGAPAPAPANAAPADELSAPPGLQALP